MDDFRQLRHLVALSEHGTLTAAAGSLGISKSALSQSIRRIEDLYGVVLFERGQRGIQPTIYAKALAAGAQQGLTLSIQMRRDIELLKNMESGRLAVGCDPTLSELLLPSVLSRIVGRHPSVQFLLKSGFWPEQAEALRSSQIDVYVGILPDDDISEFDVRHITLPGLVAFCRQGHPLCDRDALRWCDVFEYPIVGPQLPEWFNARLDAMLEELSLTRQPGMFVITNDFGTMRELVRKTDAISGGFREVVENDGESPVFVILPMHVAPMETPLPCIVALKRDRVLPPLALHVVETITSVAAELVEADATWIAAHPELRPPLA